MTASSGTTLSYQWLKNGANISGATSSSYTISSVKAGDAGGYSVKVVNAGGSVVSSTATLTVIVPPTITSQPQSVALSIGQTAVFSVGTSGTLPMSYRWRLAGTNLAGATNATVTLTNVQTSQAGNYSVVVMNIAGSVTSTVATLTVYVPPGITTQPQDQTVIAGQNASFSVVATGTPPPSYQWCFNGTNLAAATNPILARNNAQATNAGSYTVVVTNAAGSVTSTVAILTVLAPPGITTQPQNQAVVRGQNTSFSVVATGTTPLSYQWNFNGAAISGSTNSTCTISNAQLANAGTYTVGISNALGTVISSNAVLTVGNPPISVDNTSSASANAATLSWSHTVGSGNNRILIVGVAIHNSARTVTSVTYGSQNLSFIGQSVDGNGKIEVNLYQLFAPPVGTANVTIVINSSDHMSGGAVSFTGVSPMSPLGTFASAGGQSLSGSVNVSSATNGVVVDIMGATGKASTLTAGANQLQQWNGQTGTGPGDAIGASSTEIGSTTTTMSWSLGTSQAWALGAVALNPLPPLALQTDIGTTQTGPTNVIAGANYACTIAVTNAGPGVATNIVLTETLPSGAIFFSASGGGASNNGAVIWPSFNLASGSSTNFTLILTAPAVGTLTNIVSSTSDTYDPVTTNNDGSASTATIVTLVNIPVPPAISAQSQPKNQVVKVGQNATFTVVATGTAPFGYQWTFNSTNLVGATNATLSLPGVQTNDAGTYSVVVTNVAGSITSSNATLTVYVPPTITTQPTNQVLIQGQTAAFTVAANGTSPFGYQWSINGTNISGATDTSLTLTDIQPTDAGSYAVIVTNIAGSTTSSVATLTVYVPPTITTQPTSQALIQGQTAAFTVTANGTSPFGYQWSVNGTNISGATNTLLTLTNIQTMDAGSYAVIVTNIAGSVTSSVATLTVYVPPTITAQPASQALIQGQTAAFTVTVDGTAPFGYQWTFNNTNLTDATNSTLTLDNVQTNDAGTYAVVVANAAGSVTSSNATLTVIVPPNITTPPVSQTVAAGQNASFSVTATGTGPLTYQWSFSGTNLVGATNAWLTVTNVRTAQAGSYTILVTNSAGSAASAATLIVTNPIITLTVGDGAMTPGGFNLQVSVPVGVTCVILASTDLQNWLPIATNVATTGSEVFTDASATNYSARFYQVMVP